MLISKGIRLGWFFGIFSALLYVYLTYETSLYLQSFLQLSYVFLGFWGFYSWGNKNSIHIQKMSKKMNIGILAVGICLVFCFIYILSFTNQDMAILDSIVSVFSIIATILTALMYIENWIYWWGVNLLAIYLFYMQGLEFTTILYGVYFIISIYGYREWTLKMTTSLEKD